jgi:hypothetical protein
VTGEEKEGEAKEGNGSEDKDGGGGRATGEQQEAKAGNDGAQGKGGAEEAKSGDEAKEGGGGQAAARSTAEQKVGGEDGGDDESKNYETTRSLRNTAEQQTSNNNEHGSYDEVRKKEVTFPLFFKCDSVWEERERKRELRAI